MTEGHQPDVYKRTNVIMDPKKICIAIDGKFKTSQISKCEFNQGRRMYEITFLQGGKTYLYHRNRVQVLDTPTKLDIADCHINLNGYRFPNATALYRFSGCQRTY